MSIRKSLQTSMIVVAGLPIILFAILALILTYNNYLKITQEAIKSTAMNYQEGFEAQLNTQIVESEAIALDNDIISFLLKKYNDPEYDLLSDIDTRNKIEEKLVLSADTFDNNIVYSIYSLDGVVVCSSDASLPGTTSPYVDELNESLTYTQINSTTILNNRENSLNILSPVSVKGKYIVGCVVTSIDARYFENFVSAKGNSYIIDSADNDLLGIHLDDAVIRRNALSILNSYTGDSEELHGFISKGSLFSTELYGYSILPSNHWIYLIKQDSSIYHSILQTIPVVLIIVIVVFFIITIISSAKLAKQYTSPILDLRDQMRLASGGDLTVHSDIDRKDEFGELADHFNEMMSIISSNYDELNEVKQELELKQQELQANYIQIEKLAFTDALTGLNNRLAFMHHVNEVFDDKTLYNQRAVLFIDLDNFKTVNDTLGHDYGDLLLKQVSNQLTGFMTEHDFLARTGGDEFLVLRDKVTSRRDLEAFSKKLISIVETPFDLDGEIAHVSMSLGIAIFPEHGLSSNEIIKNADIAMYSAKTSGKNAYRFFDSSMEDEVSREREIEEILRDAIANKEVSLVYQPQCNMRTGRITGCEALMRLNNIYFGEISPVEFIPIAESSGLINELGLWALRTACNFNQKLIDSGLGPLTMSVNVSVEQLKNPNFAEQVQDILAATGMESRYLELEVTESVMMKNIDQNINVIKQLRNLGIKIALDDFGTGYSSFNYLTKIPIDTLKMDKSFVDNINNNSRDCHVAESIIALAHNLQISVVAEGVETTDQLLILKKQGCDILQGYIFSRPLLTQNYQDLIKSVNFGNNQ